MFMSNYSNELSGRVKRQMNQPQIHEAWEKIYRTVENERFFEQAYDDFVRRIGQRAGSRALDIGCGICANSIRLARRGYIVSAADYSEPILVAARENLSHHDFSDRITVGREDILDLSFPSNHFDLVLCWGVLMHIPDAERAISELTRVVKRGGFLVLEEINQRAPEAWLMRTGWSALKKNIVVKKTPRGHEQTCPFEGETLFWRHANTRWLIDRFAIHSCNLVRRDSGMFSEMYTYLPGQFLRATVHAWNRFWGRYLKLPHLALHNIFVFRKEPTA
jgi:2-polyprenyl-3-methyl-5-hydroxy-6-metoxy-1,4-benzoquinol methylase